MSRRWRSHKIPLRVACVTLCNEYIKIYDKYGYDFFFGQPDWRRSLLTFWFQSRNRHFHRVTRLWPIMMFHKITHAVTYQQRRASERSDCNQYGSRSKRKNQNVLVSYIHTTTITSVKKLKNRRSMIWNITKTCIKDDRYII
jgi:hypothetical protein